MTRILLDKTRDLRRNYIQTHQQELRRLAEKGQKPTLMYIGCSDSRVDPEPLVGAGPGDVFVVRTVANIVPPPDDPAASVVGAALEFAIDNLAIPHLAVCGHTDCGGIWAIERGVEPGASHPHLARWLALAGEVAGHPVNDAETAEQRHVQLVEANVRLQRDRLMLYPTVANAVNEGRLKLHAWYFNLADQKMHYYDAQANAFLAE